VAKSYQGTLILISHDRDFLDPVVDKIIHIEQQTMFEYTGNYSSLSAARNPSAQQQAMYESAARGASAKLYRSLQGQSHQSQAGAKPHQNAGAHGAYRPGHVDNPFHFSFRAPESLPNPLLKMEKVSAGYGDRVILDSIKLNLVPGRVSACWAATAPVNRR
jgi:ATP-binding cassette subfamily F protein 3